MWLTTVAHSNRNIKQQQEERSFSGPEDLTQTSSWSRGGFWTWQRKWAELFNSDAEEEDTQVLLILLGNAEDGAAQRTRALNPQPSGASCWFLVLKVWVGEGFTPHRRHQLEERSVMSTSEAEGGGWVSPWQQTTPIWPSPPPRNAPLPADSRPQPIGSLAAQPPGQDDIIAGQ